MDHTHTDTQKERNHLAGGKRFASSAPLPAGIRRCETQPLSSCRFLSFLKIFYQTKTSQWILLLSVSVSNSESTCCKFGVFVLSFVFLKLLVRTFFFAFNVRDAPAGCTSVSIKIIVGFSLRGEGQWRGGLGLKTSYRKKTQSKSDSLAHYFVTCALPS